MFDIAKVLPSDWTEFDTCFWCSKREKLWYAHDLGSVNPARALTMIEISYVPWTTYIYGFRQKNLLNIFLDFLEGFLRFCIRWQIGFYLIEILSHVPLAHSLAAISRCKHYLFILYHYLVYTYYFYKFKFTTPINMSLGTIYARYQQ